MSFLQLPAASRRLRQAAKAHAAGEMAREDYRRMRREVINELHIEFAATGDGVDAFTLGPDSTERRGNLTASPQQIQTSSPQPSRNATRRNALVAAAVFIGVLSLFFAGNALGAATTTIPAVIDRDPNPQNSLVLPIVGVRVQTLSQAPRIRETELAEQVSVWFSEAKARSLKVGSSGFSGAELDELGGLLNRLGVHDRDGLSPRALAALNTLVAGQKERRQLTLTQLERMAEKVQGYFRERGYLVARAYVPAQTLVGNRAVIHVLPGRLESVVTESATGLATLAKNALEVQLGGPATAHSLEQVLYKLNSLKGVKATGSLRAGQDVGSTSLDLQLSNPSRVSGGFFVDNHGDRRSTKYRLRGHLNWLNPLGRGDVLSADLQQGYDSQTATGFNAEYRTPTNRLGDVAAISYAQNDFTVDRSAAGESDELTDDIEGRSATLRLGWERQLYGRREQSLTAGVSGALQRLRLADVNQSLWWIEPRVTAHRVFDDSRWVLRGDAAVVAGKLGAERYPGQSASFGLVRAQLSAWRPIGVQELRLQFSGQLGTEDLPDSFKQTLGGLRRVAAIRPGSFLTDSALVMGLEMSATPARLRPYGALAFYTRIGSGNREFQTGQASAFAWEGGIVWRLLSNSSLTGELRLGIPLSVDGLTESGDEDARVLLSLGWRPWGD